jgi:hypothetical protein
MKQDRRLLKGLNWLRTRTTAWAVVNIAMNISIPWDFFDSSESF